jgi:predicted Zn-dependent protease
MNGLAWVYHKKKDSRARATAEAAFAQHPDYPQIQDTLGYILVEAGETKRGHELIKAAASAAPNDPDIQYHLAWSLSKLGDRAGARDRLSRLLAMPVKFASRHSAEQLQASLGKP